MTSVARFWGPLGLILVLIQGLGACAPEPASFDSREPGARLEASFRAVDQNDVKSVDQLIRMLASDDPAERLVAIRSLERLTGQTLGYHHQDSEDDRQAAIDRWVAWSKSRKAETPPAARADAQSAQVPREQVTGR